MGAWISHSFVISLFNRDAALIASSLGAPFLLVVVVVYIYEDWPKAVFCLLRFRSLKWIKPVTKEGKEGLARYKEEKKQNHYTDCIQFYF